MIAFTAPQLQPCLTAGFIIAYAQQVLVEKFNVLSFMRHILPTTATISRHTDIVHICPLPEGKDRGTRYVGSTPRSDLGVTNCQFSVHRVCALDLGSLQARGLYIFWLSTLQPPDDI